MAEENFLIGQLAARTGRSVHTIRWYEAQGLIPGVARDSGRRRVYGELHISWLDLMDRLRRTGMSIAEMREYTELVKQGSSTLGKRQALLAAHREQVKGMIGEWQQALTLLNSKIDFYDEWVASGKRPAVKSVKTIGRVVGAPTPHPGEKPRRAAKA
ncbi:MAG: MerR family transcriptional regulator [Polaromonas sp.]